MAVLKLKYKTLGDLLKKNISKTEDDSTALLIKFLKPSKIRGWLNKDELVMICKWKSARAIRHIESNHPKTIKKLTKSAFATRSEELKIEELTKLKGVSIPMASAILMLTNPKRYGVIDIRVWEIMFEMGIMKTNSRGINFNFKEWYRLLVIMRHYSKKLNVTVRDIERTIFEVHKNHQTGLLYAKLK